MRLGPRRAQPEPGLGVVVRRESILLKEALVLICFYPPFTPFQSVIQDESAFNHPFTHFSSVIQGFPELQ